ncbi:hypothetical protein GJV44_00462 [Candidatus Vallotia cooleyia]|nr:hypothetical protein GJV44_00462 [Candidatus Vallotia cooleyia]
MHFIVARRNTVCIPVLLCITNTKTKTADFTWNDSAGMQMLARYLLLI